jgi:hypothetical protein
MFAVPSRAVIVREPCACRKSHPRRSSGMFVLVEDSAQALATSYASASTASNTPGNFPSRSRIKNRAGDPASCRSMTRFRSGPLPRASLNVGQLRRSNAADLHSHAMPLVTEARGLR